MKTKILSTVAAAAVFSAIAAPSPKFENGEFFGNPLLDHHFCADPTAVEYNGAPFDTQHALGPEAGHFGLSGMRERARRSGFTVSFASKRRTTSVRLEIKT